MSENRSCFFSFCYMISMKCHLEHNLKQKVENKKLKFDGENR